MSQQLDVSFRRHTCALSASPSPTFLRAFYLPANSKLRVALLDVSDIMPQDIVIDGRGHLLGRLASTVAKELLVGTSCVSLATRAHLEETKYNYVLRKKTGVRDDVVAVVTSPAPRCDP